MLTMKQEENLIVAAGVATTVLVVWFIIHIFSLDQEFTKACEAKGGVAIHTSKGLTCVKEEIVLK